MKIIQINAVYKYASTGRTTMEMHEYCLQNGVESSVFCTNTIDEKNNIFLIGSKLDRKIHSLCSHFFGKQGFFSHRATKKMIEKLNSIQPDVAILRNLHSNYINLPLLLGYLSKKDIATIVVMHDCWFFTGHCTHYFSAQCNKWQTECNKCKLIKTGNSSFFFDRSRSVFRKKKQLFDSIPRLGVIGVSDWITSEAKKSMILSNARVFKRVYNWIDFSKFYPRNTDILKGKLGIKNEFIVLGVASIWDSNKGLEHFIRIAKLASDIKVILIGSFVSEVPSIENLISVGQTNDVNELAEYYSLADALLVCSPQETFGKVSAEALACGTPVIANDRTANPEIAGNDCGFITHNNDDAQILEAINMIRKYGKGYFSEKCIERAKNNFYCNSQIEEYLEVANDLMLMDRI